MEMKVDIVEFVENEMVELDVAQIGWNWGWGEVGCDYGGDGRGDKGRDGNAKKTNPAGILPNPLHPINTTPPNQPNPIAQSIFPHLQ